MKEGKQWVVVVELNKSESTNGLSEDYIAYIADGLQTRLADSFRVVSIAPMYSVEE